MEQVLHLLSVLERLQLPQKVKTKLFNFLWNQSFISDYKKTVPRVFTADRLEAMLNTERRFILELKSHKTDIR